MPEAVEYASHEITRSPRISLKLLAAVITAAVVGATFCVSRGRRALAPPVPGNPFQPAAAVQAPATSSGDIAASLLTLMKTEEIGSEVFTCPTTQPTVYPSAGAEKWDFGGGTNTALNWSNWNTRTTSHPGGR
jgi:hypothetical protein